MRAVTYILLLFSFCLHSQNMNIECGQDNTVREQNTPIQIDTLFFNGCQRGFLIQDNAILFLKEVIGIGEIRRGGKAGAPMSGGIDRFEGDANPMIVLIGCPSDFDTLEIGPYIDVTTITDFCNE